MKYYSPDFEKMLPGINTKLSAIITADDSLSEKNGLSEVSNLKNALSKILSEEVLSSQMDEVRRFYVNYPCGKTAGR